MTIPDIPQLKPFEVLSKDKILTISICKEFDFGSLHQDWSYSIISMNPGPYEYVYLDMSMCGLMSSTFFAGLMQLHFHYTERGAQPLTLIKPDHRVVRNLALMHMSKMFVVIER
jgi:hypothetical protein